MSVRSGRISLIICAALAAALLVDCFGGSGPTEDGADTVEARTQPTDDPSSTASASDRGADRERPTPAKVAAEPADPIRRTLRAVLIEDQFVIAYRDGVGAPERKALRDELGLRLLRPFPTTNSELVVSLRRVADEELRERIAARDEVRFAEPNAPVFASAAPNDELFPTLWGLDNQGQAIGAETGTPDADIDAPEAWDMTTGSSGVVVAVVDTGVDLQHVDLAQNMWVNPGEIAGNGQDDDGNGLIDDSGGWDWIDADARPEDQDGHGTHVAGTIAAVGDNSVGVTGVAWNSTIMPLRVLGADGSGTTADVAAAFDYAGAAGADVVNASLGGGYPSRAIADAIAAHPNTLYVVAAGNDSADLDATPQYPCAYELANLLCVAATDNRDELASYSNHSERWVHLAAPGTLINSTVPPFVRIFTDGFSDLSNWTTGGTTPWSDATAGTRTYAGDSPGALYQPGTDSFLELTPSLDLRDGHACHALFRLRLATATEEDRALLESSVAGGSWNRVARFSGTTEGQWVLGAADLSGLDGREIRLRWRLVAPSGRRDDGIDLDGFSVWCQGATYDGNEYDYFSGTSMATPHVAGAAALLFSATDLSANRVATALQEGVDPVPALTGAVASGGRLNVDRSLRLMVEASPSPEASPEQTPTESAETEDAAAPRPRVSRSVSLRLSRHLVAKGRVKIDGGRYGACRNRVMVRVFRGSKAVGRDVTSRYGYFRERVPDRRGRYRAVAVSTRTDPAKCLRATSPTRRHRH